MHSVNDAWLDFVPTVVKPVIYAYKYRKFIQKYWKKAQVFANLGKPNIVITGRSGAGKSVLAAHYHGEANSLDWVEPGTSSDVEIKPIEMGKWTQIVAVIPGQNSKERAVALDSAFNKHDGLEGVIHVVDWGYTRIRDIAIQQEMATKGIDSISKLREHNISLELKDFELMVDKIKMSIANGRGPKWLVIAVNKMDLYQSELEDARQYYHPGCSGAFSQIINDLYTAVGANNIKIVCLPVCSMPEVFSWNGEEMKPQIDSITIQRSYLRSFVDNLALLQDGV